MRFLSGVLLLAMLAGCATAADRVGTGGIVYPGDSAGFFERLAAGNLDVPGSAAYNRWGAGYAAGIDASDRKFQRPY